MQKSSDLKCQLEDLPTYQQYLQYKITEIKHQIELKVYMLHYSYDMYQHRVIYMHTLHFNKLGRSGKC